MLGKKTKKAWHHAPYHLKYATAVDYIGSEHINDFSTIYKRRGENWISQHGYAKSCVLQ